MSPLREQQLRLLRELEQWYAAEKVKVQSHGGQRNGDVLDAEQLDNIYHAKRQEIAQVCEQVELIAPGIGRAFPYAEYTTRADARVRPTHAAMHGFVALRSWPGWRIIRPGNGWGCRCGLVFRTKRQAIQRGWMAADGTPLFEVRWPNAESKANFDAGRFPDEGWHGPKFVAADAESLKVKRSS